MEGWTESDDQPQKLPGLRSPGCIRMHRTSGSEVLGMPQRRSRRGAHRYFHPMPPTESWSMFVAGSTTGSASRCSWAPCARVCRVWRRRTLLGRSGGAGLHYPVAGTVPDLVQDGGVPGDLGRCRVAQRRYRQPTEPQFPHREEPRQPCHDQARRPRLRAARGHSLGEKTGRATPLSR